MDICPIRFDVEALEDYAALFKACFPQSTKFSASYLKWLYCHNPEGQAIGFDARDGTRLAAHYVCIPICIVLQNRLVRAMLSLNTATHPQYQGRGLFTQLAERTYAHAGDTGIAAVCGIANSNSTPGFTRKLGFTLIESLHAAIGAGNLAVAPASTMQAASFRYQWSREALLWRCANPANPVVLRPMRDRLQCTAAGVNRMLRVYAELPLETLPHPASEKRTDWITPRLFLGLVPGRSRIGAYCTIPPRLRPSPLNFIFRPLSSGIGVPAKGEISLSFLDFDAY